ncbi:MAG: FtsQ-type POTRA domain-containing protein [Deltaproteobacteria bacterium]|nr:FtsQ-type POTRA domain-containing protein [Deltaproteobacteria bacterium]
MRSSTDSSKFSNKKNNRRILIRLIYLTVTGLGIFGLGMGGRFVAGKIVPRIKQSELFKLKGFVVRASDHIAEEEMKTFLDPFLGKNIFVIDLEKIKQKVKRHPWIQDIKVTRVYPDRIRLQFSEKKPKAILSAEKLYFLDEEGKVIHVIRPEDDTNFPVISGISISQSQSDELIQSAFEIMDLYQKNEYLRDWPISEIHWQKKSEFVIYTSNPSFEIRLGMDRLTKKFERLEKVLKDLSQKRLIPRYIDLNFTKKVVVKLSK